MCGAFTDTVIEEDISKTVGTDYAPSSDFVPLVGPVGPALGGAVTVDCNPPPAAARCLCAAACWAPCWEIIVAPGGGGIAICGFFARSEFNPTPSPVEIAVVAAAEPIDPAADPAPAPASPAPALSKSVPIYASALPMNAI
jgi:hypothetical protein